MEKRKFVIWDDSEEGTERRTYEAHTELGAVEQYGHWWHDEFGHLMDDTRVCVQREDGSIATWDVEIETVPRIVATRLGVTHTPKVDVSP